MKFQTQNGAFHQVLPLCRVSGYLGDYHLHGGLTLDCAKAMVGKVETGGQVEKKVLKIVIVSYSF